MDTILLTILILICLIFASAFLIQNRRQPARILLYFSIAWEIEAFRLGVKLAQSAGIEVPAYWSTADSLLQIPLTALIALGILDHFKSGISRSWVAVYSSAALLLYFGLQAEGIHKVSQDLLGDPAALSRYTSLATGLVLSGSGGVIRVILSGMAFSGWLSDRKKGGLLLSVCLAVDGLFGVSQILGPFSSMSFEQESLKMLQILGYSLALVLLVINRESALRIEAENQLKESQRSTAHMTRNLPGMAFRCLLDGHRTMKFLSAGCKSLTGYSPGEIQDNMLTSYSQLILPEDQALVKSAIETAVRDRRMVDVIYRILTARGKVKWAWEKGEILPGENGKPCFVEGFISDVTQLREVEMELERTNAELAKTVQKVEQRAQQLSTLNRFGEALQGCHSMKDLVEATEKTCKSLFEGFSGGLFLVRSEDSTAHLEGCWGEAEFEKSKIQTLSCGALRHGRAYTNIEETLSGCCAGQDSEGVHICTPIQAHGEALGILSLRADGHSRYFLTQNKDNIEQLSVAAAEHLFLAISNLRLKAVLREQAIRDPLTGLFNRRHMQESLEREVSRAQRRQSCLGLLVIDLDHFKRFNDVHGHSAGDLVLREVAAYLKRSFRAEDTVCRFGGEEFVVIMPDISMYECLRRAEELRQGLHSVPLIYEGAALNGITASIGVALFPDCGNNKESLFEAADKAVYAAKSGGRNRVVRAERIVESFPSSASSTGS